MHVNCRRRCGCAQVRSIAEMGAYVSLLEYGNIEGMILLSELSRRRIRSVQKLIKVGPAGGGARVLRGQHPGDGCQCGRLQRGED